MSDGYLYCFSNDSMPGILKVGMTERTPEIRLNEANSSDTWRPPTPYEIEFAKKVLNPKQKETTLHNLLSQYTDRINPKREFFRVSPEEVKTFFDLIDGDFWVKYSVKEKKNKKISILNNRDISVFDTYFDTSKILTDEEGEDEEDEEEKEEKEDEEDEEDEEDKEEEEDKEDEEDNQSTNSKSSVTKCRDMSKCFTNGQRIRHTIGISKTWIGIYDSSKNVIIHNEKIYQGRSPLNQFASSHYKTERNDRVSTVNAWSECECEVNEKWVSTYNL
jgi:hypothetical protein